MFPGILQHPGVKFNTFVSSMYFPQEGIFGVTLWVVSTIVFHFVLFGVIAQRTGLGQLFIDNATILAGRYTGGPAKVSVVSSAFFGTISGSSVANTVSTGALTIPNMKRLGYPGHFAGGVEAAASAGGQITPPIMGAAAFIMAEFLEVPYTTIVIAAIFPALLHYVGVFAVVHLMARRLGLKGLGRETCCRKLAAVWRDGWANVVPLVGLLVVLFSGYTPYMSAFCGISLAIIAGMSRMKEPVTLVYALAFIAFVVWKYRRRRVRPVHVRHPDRRRGASPRFNPQRRVVISEMADTFETGVKYALAVGAASAAVGIVDRRDQHHRRRLPHRLHGDARPPRTLATISISALPAYGGCSPFSPSKTSPSSSASSFIAIACILMGAGIPTTALYIMLVSVAQPALAQLGVPPIASHMFVLYYGVVAEITPPVCTSAYAAAAIANCQPVPNRDLGLHAWPRQGRGAHGLRLCAGAALRVVDRVRPLGIHLYRGQVASPGSSPCRQRWWAIGSRRCAQSSACSWRWRAWSSSRPSLQADLVALIIAAPAVLSQVIAPPQRRRGDVKPGSPLAELRPGRTSPARGNSHRRRAAER